MLLAQKGTLYIVFQKAAHKLKYKNVRFWLD